MGCRCYRIPIVSLLSNATLYSFCWLNASIRSVPVRQGKEKEVDAIKLRFAGTTNSDHLMYVKAYDAWRSATTDGDNGFCWRNFMAPTVLQQLK